MCSFQARYCLLHVAGQFCADLSGSTFCCHAVKLLHIGSNLSWWTLHKSLTKCNHFLQLSVVKLKVVLPQTVESGEKTNRDSRQPSRDFRFPGTVLWGISCLRQMHGSSGYQLGGSVLEAGLWITCPSSWWRKHFSCTTTCLPSHSRFSWFPSYYNIWVIISAGIWF